MPRYASAPPGIHSAARIRATLLIRGIDLGRVASAVFDELEVGGEGEAVAVPGAELVQGEDGHVPVESQGLPYRVVPTAKAQSAAGPDAPASSPSPATSPTSATTAPPSSAVNTAACSAHRQDATQPGSATPEQHRGIACLFSASTAIRTKLFLGRPPIGWGTAWAA
jgi:hypothetical protein